MPADLFIIVNFADIGEHPKDDYNTGLHIPDLQKPSFIHLNRQSACDELLRLAKADPSGKYVLFDAILFARAKHSLDHGIDIARSNIFEIAPIAQLCI